MTCRSARLLPFIISRFISIAIEVACLGMWGVFDS